MANYIGSFKEIAFTKESVRGTTVIAISGDWQPHLGYDFAPVTEKIKDDPAMGRIEENINSNAIKYSSEGSVPLRLTKQFAGHIFNMVFGQAPTTTGASPYTHTWALANNNQHLTYTVTINDPVKGFKRYPFVMANEVTLEFTTDDYAKATIGLVGGKETTSGLASTAYSTTDSNFIPKNITIKTADTYAGLSSGTAKAVEGITVTFAKNVEKVFALGSDEPTDIMNAKFGVALSLTVPYSDTDLRDWANSDTKKAVQIDVTDGTNSITLKFPRMGFENWKGDNDIKGRIKNTVEMYGERDTTNGIAVVVLVNATATY